MPQINKTKKITNLPTVKSKSKNKTSLSLTKQKELKKLITAYQQVGISLTKLLKSSK